MSESINRKVYIMQDSWKFYKNAMLPSCKPHEEADISVFDNKKIWQQPLWKKALFAKYTSDWDCRTENSWYWIVNDSPFDVSKLKSKYRYEMKKAQENFDVKVIDPLSYVDDLYEIRVSSLSSYPKAYRIIPEKEQFAKSVGTFKKPTFGAFYRETGKLCGYITIVERDEVVYYSGQDVIKEYEKKYVNYALILKMLDYYSEKIQNGGYIVDGERNINHITKHQELLVKKFGFRKVYCKLNIKYRPIMKFALFFLYPLRNLFKKYDSNKFVHMINGVLLLEEIHKNQNI